MMRLSHMWLGLVLLLSGLPMSCMPDASEDNCLFPVREGQMYGFANANGKVKIPPQFAYTLPFAEGLGAFNVGGKPAGRDMPSDGKWGFVNVLGEIVINPKFDSPPVKGMPYVTESAGKVLHDAYVFSEGWAAVIKDGRWVYIDARGEIVLDQTANGRRFDALRAFREGLANVMVDGRWGYMDKGGRFLLDPQFLLPADFQEGHALVVLDDNGRKNWILINKAGKRVLPEYRIVSNVYDGVVAVMGDLKGVPERDGHELRYWFSDTSGIRVPEEPQFDLVGHFGEGLCPVLVGSEPSKERESFRDLSQAARRIGGQYGYIRRNGTFAFIPTFDDAKSFHQGLAAVKKEDYWAYMNAFGEYVTEFEFRWAGDFNACGIAKVQLGPAHNDYDGHFAYLSLNGDLVWIEQDLPY